MTESASDKTGAGTAARMGLFLGPVAAGAILAAGAPDGVSTAAWHTAAMAVLMAVWWMTEAIPIPATALLPLALFPLLGIADTGATAKPYAHPLVFLFLGGFMIALAMQRWNLHRRMALSLIARVGTRPARLVAGFMIATAALSMWVSNTATTLMMLPIAVSVIELLESDERDTDRNFAIALVLGIAYAASIGGIGTLIGTPPNAFMAAFMEESYGVTIGFGRWMAIGVPLVAVLLPLGWLVLVRVVYPVGHGGVAGAGRVIADELAALGPMSRGEKVVLAVFAATAAAWIFRPLLRDLMPGVDLTDTAIAMTAAVALFVIPVDWRARRFALDWQAAERLPWGVLILFGGGLTLAAAIKDTGLAQWIGGGTAQLADQPAVVVVACVAALILLLTEMTSNTATTATFLPIVASVAVGLGENPLLLVVPAALAASGAFMLPVATPPNAIVFASGRVTIAQMIRSGIVMNAISLAVVVAVAYTLLPWVLGATPGVLPDWARP